MRLTSVVRPVTWTVGAILIVLTAGCGYAHPTKADRERELLGMMREKYDARIAERRPDRVVITYPTSAEALPEIKRSELGVLREVLRARGIPFETRAVSAALTKVASGKREYDAFALPAEVASGAQVLYVNLDAEDLPTVVANPDAKQRGVVVRIWNDPVRITATRGV